MIKKVSDYLYRGPHPSSMQALADLGVKQILSLQTGVDDLVNGTLYGEDTEAKRLGITIAHFPLNGVLPPTQQQLDYALRILLSQRNFYVHCKHGVDRTGMVCAAYRIRVQKWPREKAIREMYDHGFHYFPLHWLGWEKAL